jgi:phosphotransferase system enzyme I (PtsI)
MVEVPSATLLSGPILGRAASASIGTNDLTLCGGAQQRRPVGVCGEAAADPAFAVVLVGLGVATLSMTALALPDVAATLASATLGSCRRLAELAFTAESADGARAGGARAASRAGQARALIPPVRGSQAGRECLEGFLDAVACGDTPES